MRRPRAQGRGTEFPIELELVATDEPIEVALSSTERRGSNDSGRRGDCPRLVRSGGRTVPIGDLEAEWSSVLPGIEARVVARSWSIGDNGSTDPRPPRGVPGPDRGGPGLVLLQRGPQRVRGDALRGERDQGHERRKRRQAGHGHADLVAVLPLS